MVTAENLLNAWEQGINKALTLRAIYLLELFYPELILKDIPFMSIGERDARLLHVRNKIFGPNLNIISKCPLCSEDVEWEMNIQKLQLKTINDYQLTKSYNFKTGEFEINFRLPNINDLTLYNINDTADINYQRLISACINRAIKDAKEIAVSELPETIFKKLEEQMESEDPQANIKILLSCPTCSNKWKMVFDIVDFLWEEINSWAKRMMQDIFNLAVVFGWSEREILKMSAVRRSIYLDMIK